MTAPLDHRNGPFSGAVTSAAGPVADVPRDDDEQTLGPWAFVKAHGPAIGAGLGVVGLAAIVVWFFVSGDDTPPPRRVQEFTIINVPPPPPPPPPEVQPQPETEPEMIEQKPIVEPEIKEETKVEEPKDAPPNPKDEPPAGPLGMDKSAEGPGDNFGLVGRPGGRGLVGGGGGGGSRWGAFAAIVQQQLEAALHANAKVRKAVMQVQVRVWVDSTGRVTRVQLASSSGDPELDAAIRDEALVGVMMRSPPPADMPMPMVTRITTRRPS